MPYPYQSICSQVTAILRTKLKEGEWANGLPPERQLALQLGASRKTIRKALAILRDEKLIRTERNKGSELAKRQTGSAPRGGPSIKVALLMPDPLEISRPFTVLWVNHLMTLLHNAHIDIEVITGSRYFGEQSDQSLRKLIHTHPDRIWILARSHLSIQRWFAAKGIRTLVAGTSYGGVNLPSVDSDHYAACRHAAMAFLRLGHRKLAMFVDKTGHGGDLSSEQGFKDGIRDYGETTEPIICRSRKGTASVISDVKRVLNLPDPPTGYLINSAFSYLTISSYLSSQGYSIPQDISLIAHADEPFLPHLHPLPTRYQTSPNQLAAALYKAIKKIAEHNSKESFEIRIMSDFVKGESVGPVRRQES